MSMKQAIRVFFAMLAALAAAGDATRPNREPVAITAADMFSGRYDYQFVRITGTVQDLYHDDSDSLFRFFIIASGNETIFAPSMTISRGSESYSAATHFLPTNTVMALPSGMPSYLNCTGILRAG